MERGTSVEIWGCFWKRSKPIKPLVISVFHLQGFLNSYTVYLCKCKSHPKSLCSIEELVRRKWLMPPPKKKRKKKKKTERRNFPIKPIILINNTYCLPLLKYRYKNKTIIVHLNRKAFRPTQNQLMELKLLKKTQHPTLMEVLHCL